MTYTVNGPRRGFHRLNDESNEVLLSRAAAGDQEAWSQLVDRFGRLVWSVARGFHLNQASVADVNQTVWLRLLENIGQIREPERLAGWLATTTRRAALAVIRSHARQIPIDILDYADDNDRSLDELIVEDEEAQAVLSAFAQLPDDCRQLLRLLLADPPLSYEEIAAVTGRPAGSIGPTRGRCLQRLEKVRGGHN